MKHLIFVLFVLPLFVIADDEDEDFPDIPDIQGFVDFPFTGRHFPKFLYGHPPPNEGGSRGDFHGRTNFGHHYDHGIETKVRNETRGNMKVEEVERDGNGYHSFSRLTTFDGRPHFERAHGNFHGPFPHGHFPHGHFSPGHFPHERSQHGQGQQIVEEEDMSNHFIDEPGENGTKREECNSRRPCPDSKFCDPISMSCSVRSKDGENCFMKGQCVNEGKGVLCIYGKCRKGEKGEAGSLCTSHEDCQKTSCCTPGGSGIRMCRTRLDEGAVCGEFFPMSGIFDFGLMKRGRHCNPCKDTLQCVQQSGFVWSEKTCIPEKYVDTLATDNGNVYDNKEAANEGSGDKGTKVSPPGIKPEPPLSGAKDKKKEKSKEKKAKKEKS